MVSHNGMRPGACRSCGVELHETFADLGLTPLANALLPPDHSNQMEPFYPLHAFVCSECKCVQLVEFERPQAIFGDYLYFSSYSESWLQHARAFATEMIGRLQLGTSSLVLEIASNDGYLLQYFQERGVSVFGVDPAANVAGEAIAKGIQTEIAFFGAETARRLRGAGLAPDLVVANNVLAHVPDLHDFIEGVSILLPPQAVASFEFPHLLQLMRQNQFDTIYHEHFSYFSLFVVQELFLRHGLAIFDVDELPTHGGSLRISVRHSANGHSSRSTKVERVLAGEREYGLHEIDAYRRFAARTVETKCALLDFFVSTRRRGKRVVGYGAPAKGNTLLNYCGIGPELLPFTVDRSPHKQGLLLPGTRIPVREPSAILEAKPDYLFILPWNLRDEIAEQMSSIRGWGGRFVVPIPELEIF